MKCLNLLRVNRTMATSAARFTRTLFNIFWPMVNTLFQQDHQLGPETYLSILVTVPQCLRSELAFCVLPEMLKKRSSSPLLDLRTYLDDGTVQHGESPVSSKLRELQLTFSLPSDSDVSPPGPEDCEGPPLLLERFPLPWTCLSVLCCSVDSSGTYTSSFITFLSLWLDILMHSSKDAVHTSTVHIGHS